jgi:hypothetical protein
MKDMEDFENQETVKQLRALHSAISNRPGSKQSKMYWSKVLPDFQAVATRVQKASYQVLEKCAANEPDYLELQQTIIVGCQILMPPIRGKPYYTLSLVDDGEHNSMN